MWQSSLITLSTENLKIYLSRSKQEALFEYSLEKYANLSIKDNLS